MENPVFVLYGKSKSGKDESIKYVLENYPQVKKVVAHTSRDMRPREQDGLDYHFHTLDEATDIFNYLNDESLLMTHARFHDNLYFTSLGDLSRIIEDSKMGIMHVEDDGIIQLLELKEKGVLNPILINIKRENIDECPRTSRDEGHYYLDPSTFNHVLYNDGTIKELHNKLDDLIKLYL